MGGDQLDGFAIAMTIVMLLLILGAVLVLALIGRAVARKAAPGRRRIVILLAAIAGAGIGWTVMMAIFYQSSVDSWPQLHLDTAPGFNEPWVILLEDPRGQELVWSESGLLFKATTARLAVPPSGIVRVRSFGLMAERSNINIVWPNGLPSSGVSTGPAPPGSGATASIAIMNTNTTLRETPSLDGPGLAAYLAAHAR